MFNKIILIGRLTRDPELRHTTQGTPVATITLAVNREYKREDGTADTDFFDVVVWGKMAEAVGKYGYRGQLCLVQGEMRSRSYEDKQGQKRKVWEVVANRVKFLDWRKEPTGGLLEGAEEFDISEEDLPF